jgi:hypothetical protein
MTGLELCKQIQHTPLGMSIRSSTWLFPTIESVHIVGLALVIGSVMWLDFRLLGFSKRASVADVSRTVMPTTWIGFGVAVVTGTLLFASEAAMCYQNLAFRLKMLMLVLIGVNAGCYEFLARHKRKEWGIERDTPASAKMTAAVSLVLWCGVIVAGRWIAYVGNM